MKIQVMGYSGSGKSTLCRKMAEKHQLPVLHLDSVQFLPGWDVRPADEKQRIVQDFLDTHPDGWVIDGNYSKLSFAQRTEEADMIIQLLFNRFSCLYRCARRYRTYKGKTRPDMAKGCNEKMDGEFVKWILWKGRSKSTREMFRSVRTQYADKTVVLRSQRQLNAFMKRQGL